MQVNYTAEDIATTKTLLKSAVALGSMKKSSVDGIIRILGECSGKAGGIDEREERALSYKSVMERLEVSRQTIYNLIERGALERVKFGKSVRIKESSVRKLIENGFE